MVTLRTRNRMSTRLVNEEARKILEVVLPVENMFIEHVQKSEELNYTYDEIFKHFNEQFQKAVTYALNKYRPKYIVVDSKYFYTKFKSKELVN